MHLKSLFVGEGQRRRMRVAVTPKAEHQMAAPRHRLRCSPGAGAAQRTREETGRDMTAGTHGKISYPLLWKGKGKREQGKGIEKREWWGKKKYLRVAELGKDKLMQNQEQTGKLNKRAKNLLALHQKQAGVHSSCKGISTIAVLVLLNLNGSCGILFIFSFKWSPYSFFFQR